jgi:hypothetical protein
MGRRTVGLRRTEPSYLDGALAEKPVRPIKRIGSAHVPAGADSLTNCSSAKYGITGRIHSCSTPL